MRKASLSFIIVFGLALQGCATAPPPPGGFSPNSSSYSQKKCSRSSGYNSFPNLNLGHGDEGAAIFLIGLIVIVAVLAIASAPLTDTESSCY